MYSLKFLSVCLLVGSCTAQESKVKVTLYYEALCPYCHQFIMNELYPGYQQVGDYVELDLVPFGNVHATSSNAKDWKCQHGPSECYLNKATACALNEATFFSQAQLLKFVYTLAVGVTENSRITVDESEVLAKKSAEDNLLSWHEIFTCIHDGTAEKLFVKYNERQESLNPKLMGVPTIWVNDVYDETLEADARTNFIAFVCNQLKGEKPSACNAELKSLKRVYKPKSR